MHKSGERKIFEALVESRYFHYVYSYSKYYRLLLFCCVQTLAQLRDYFKMVQCITFLPDYRYNDAQNALKDEMLVTIGKKIVCKRFLRILKN